MPSKVRILINKARELPIMDSTNKSTDAYVEVSFFFFFLPIQFILIWGINIKNII